MSNQNTVNATDYEIEQILNRIFNLIKSKTGKLKGEKIDHDHIEESFNSIVSDKVKEFHKLIEANTNSKCLGNIADNNLKQSIINGIVPKKFKRKGSSILDNLLRASKPHTSSLDYYSIILGMNGFLEFRELLKKEEQKEITDNKSEPIDNASLQEFFKAGSHLYVYDEDLIYVEKSQKYKAINFPRFDTLFLSWNTNNSLFELENIEEKANHKNGYFRWCKNANSRIKGDSFEIVFENHSRSDLKLRFNFPTYSLNDKKNELTLLFGIFTMTHPSGGVCSGSVILEKNIDIQKQRETGKFSYSQDFFDEGSNCNIPEEIRKYLFDRSLNLIKVPQKIANHKQLENWLEKKSKSRNYKKVANKYHFLISHPNTSIENSAWLELINKFKAIVKEDKFPGIERFQKDHKILNEYWEKIKVNDRIKIYPNKETVDDKIRKGEPEGINNEFIQEIRRSYNIMVIIPNLKFIKISSLWVIIGAAIGLGKRIFVCFENSEDLETRIPNILKSTNEDLGYYRIVYDSLSDIPYEIKEKLGSVNLRSLLLIN